MKAVVVGAGGFLGGCVVEELVRRGARVVAIDRAIREDKLPSPDVEQRCLRLDERDALEAAFRGAEEVYHFAAKLGTSELEHDVRDALHVNIIGAYNVFEAAAKADVPRLFYASKPNVWLNTYSITKFCGEQLARHSTRYMPVQISILRYLNIYGPGQKLVPVRKILPIFAAQAMRGLPIQVYGDGCQTVDMTFSEDAARLTVDFMRAPFTDVPCDCGTGEEIKVVDVARHVNEFFRNAAGIEHVAMRIGETPNTRLVADLSALRRQLGTVAFTPLGVGLDRTLSWYATLPRHRIDAALAFYGIHQRYNVSWNS